MQESSAAAEYRISVQSLLVHPNEVQDVAMQFDAETAALYGLTCSALPAITGKLENRAGVLMLSYTLRCVLALTCDRCLGAVDMPVEESFSHIIVPAASSEQNDAEYLLAPDAMLDFAEAVMTDLRLSLPSKILCSPDCKGLCPVCGENRNAGLCSCPSAEITLEFQ